MSKSTPFFKDVTIKGQKADDQYAADGVITAESEGVDNRKILVIAGVHGNEHNAVLAAYRVYQEFLNETDDKCKNEHTIRFLIGVNRWGLLNNQREWGTRADVYPDPMPKDKPIDFNRVFADESLEKVEDSAWTMRNTIKEAIKEADIVIDVHNSPACENMVLLNNDEYTYDTIAFLEAIHHRYMVWESQTSTIKKYAIDHGKVGFTVELGGMTLGAQDEAVMDDQVSSLKTLINFLDFYMPKFKKGECLPPHMLAQPIYAKAYGLIDTVTYTRHVEMKKDMVFATMITDSDNPADAEFRAPCDGYMVACEDRRVLKPGDEIFTWQPKITFPRDYPIPGVNNDTWEKRNEQI